MPLTPDAITDAFLASHERLLRFCVALCGNEAQAQDLAAQCWYELVRMADRYEDRGVDLTVWLFRTARSRCIDLHRVAQRRPTVPLLPQDTAISMQSFEARVLERIQVTQMLRTLRPAHAQVLTLRFVEDRSLPETAQLLGLTVGATKALQHRALTHLRKEYTHA